MVRRAWGRALLAGTLVLAGSWWGWERSTTAPDSVPMAASRGAVAPVVALDGAPAASTTDSEQPAPSGIEIQLLPDGVVGARADSVRIGLAQISAEDARVYQEWLDGGSQGAGPAERSELATVERWAPATATRNPDGSVSVGPLALPFADRYDLQARGDDALHFWLAAFTAPAPPATISPTIAAGLRIQHGLPPGSAARVLLRRVGEPQDAPRWQHLLAREAPALLAAMNDSALTVAPGQVLAPLPPGPLTVILEVDGVEAQRLAVQLAAGAISDVRFDPLVAEAVRSLSIDLEMTFQVEGTREPIGQVKAVTETANGEVARESDERGRVLFENLDRQRQARFNLSFPRAEGGLPSWPEQRALELDLDTLAQAATASPAAGKRMRVSKTVELRPLQWLLASVGGFPLTTQRSVGDPWPIFVLQREQDGLWADVSADYFLTVPEGLAVSIESSGSFRVAAVHRPWSVHYSTAADNRRPNADGRYRVELDRLPGRAVELTVLHQGRTLAHAPIDVRGPIRGMPDPSLETDASGRLQLEAVTVPSVRVEVPGFEVAEVPLRAALTTVELQRE